MLNLHVWTIEHKTQNLFHYKSNLHQKNISGSELWNEFSLLEDDNVPIHRALFCQSPMLWP